MLKRIPLEKVRGGEKWSTVSGVIIIENQRGLESWNAEIFVETLEDTHFLAQGLMLSEPSWYGFVSTGGREFEGGRFVAKVNADERMVYIVGSGMLHEYEPGTLL